MASHRGDDGMMVALDDTGAGAKERLLSGLSAAAVAAANEDEP